jgi:hemolysin type calcium-binding protein
MREGRTPDGLRVPSLGRGARPTTPGRIRAVCVALVALAVMPAGAHGAVVGQGGGEGPGGLVYAADPGEANRLTISREDDRIVFTDPGAVIRPGSGCTADTSERVSCDQRTSIVVRLEDGDDEAASSGDVGARIALSGDQGDDTLRGSADVSSLDGGPGRDVLAGGPGTTFIQAADILWFGEFDALPTLAPARDTVSCAAPNPGALPTDVDAGPDDVISGPCGPVATYAAGVIDLRGTEGPDQLSERIGPTRIEALGGDDIVIGGDRADGGPGNDRMSGTGLQLGGAGNDRMDVGAHGIEGGRIAGQDGDDFITGSDGADSLTGGAGHDRISGRGGNDTIRVRDGEHDLVRCGDGRDTVVADPIDTIGHDCERTSRTGSAATAARASRAQTAVPAAAGRCGPHARGATILTHTDEGVVFKKRGFLYGCLRSVGSPHQLPSEGGGFDERGASKPSLSGRYVAYATFGSAIGDEFDRIYVYDLRLARIKLRINSNGNITAIAVKRNGSVGWIENSVVPANPMPWEVHKAADGEKQGNVLLARGTGIDPTSLSLSAERTSLVWTDGGAQRDAPID